jgi:DNA-binding NarL/FixJ family response regulator
MQHSLSAASKLRVIIVEDSAIIRARLMESLAEIPNIEVVGEVETEASALAAMSDRRWDAARTRPAVEAGYGARFAEGARTRRPGRRTPR